MRDKLTQVLYTVWSQYGVLVGRWATNKLSSLIKNNYTELLELLTTLTPRERLSVKDANFLEPLAGSLKNADRVSLMDAHRQRSKKRKQRVKDQSRRRKVRSRTTADAADAAIAATLADTHRGASLAVVTNQVAAPPRPPQGSYITHIIRLMPSGKRYEVEWSEPEGNPARTKELVQWLDNNADYRDVVLAWREQQRQEREQQHKRQRREWEELEEDIVLRDSTPVVLD